MNEELKEETLEEEVETSENNEEETEEETDDDKSKETSEETSEETELTVDDYNKLKEKNKQLFARLKKLEAIKAEVKEQKPLTNLTKENIDFEESMDVRFLKRDGYSDEDINRLKIIRAGYKSMGKNISLLDAVNDDLFKAILEKRKLEEKKEKAQLGASNGLSVGKTKTMKPEEFEKFRKEKSEEALRAMGFKR